MKIDRVHIQNFRNFNELDVRLGSHAVIVGENRAGKSNFLYALRLLLDPSLPDSARQLREEDFWDGLPRPLANDARILIEIDLGEFESDENQLAVLGGHLVSAKPMIARLTYSYHRIPGVTEQNSYEFSIYGGDRPENIVHGEIRRRLPFDFLAALRDAEGDLANWRRSPLRFLLEQAMAAVKPEELEVISKKVTEATNAVGSLAEIKELCDEVTARLSAMVGSGYGGDFTLNLASTDAYKLVRALRPFVDAGRRGISEASLGTANLIYLALKSLEFEQLVDDGHRDHTFLGIEEPEAHLHPHLQRLSFRHFFEELVGETTTVLLTTHSPHIVSVAPLKSLVVIRSDPVDGSEAVSTVGVEFSEQEIADLQRYLDVTGGEIMFGRGVLWLKAMAKDS
jgi:putative ATP-dependent endonuclease of OLD family